MELGNAILYMEDNMNIQKTEKIQIKESDFELECDQYVETEDPQAEPHQPSHMGNYIDEYR